MALNSVNKILDFAIEQEEEAARFYTELAAQMASRQMKKVFESFAKEEGQHKAKLIAVKQGKKLLSAKEKITDLKIGDHLIPVKLQSDLTYQQALIVAMKAEKAAFKLYHDLAQSADDAGLKELFLSLAQEEARHKLRFEVEYDEQILIEN
ncbi:MAG: ferritin family protein [Calditrichia bacterium]